MFAALFEGDVQEGAGVEGRRQGEPSSRPMLCEQHCNIARGRPLPGVSLWCCAADDDEFSKEEVTTPEARSGRDRGMPFLITSKFDVDHPAHGGGVEEIDGGEVGTAANSTAPASTASFPSMLSPDPFGERSPLGVGEVIADFSGSWVVASVTGDMEAFLTDMGLSEQLRGAAKTARYGVDKQVQNIAQSGDTFVVQNILRAPVTMQFRVGAGMQRSLDQEGKTILIDPTWDGPTLCVASQKETGEHIANTRRYLEGERMVLELTSPQGTAVQRIFERR